MKIKNFPEDAKITFLGEIFKFNHLKSWNIKLGIHADSELSVKHSRLSNLPAFARGRCLNPSDGQFIGVLDGKEIRYTQSDYNNYALGYQYNFSKRTRVWAEWKMNDAKTDLVGTNQTVSIGTRHDF